GTMLKRLNVGTEFVDGLRITDAETVEVVEMVLAGTVNKEVVTAINRAGGTAVGICGKDGDLIRARQVQRTTKDPDSNIEKALDLGFVGEPSFINPHILSAFQASGLIPVVAPIGVGDEGETYNINGDTAAGAIASALGATRFMLLTDVPGVLDKNKQLISELTPEKARALIADGTISGGMIPKVETCIDAVESGVEGAAILDGRQEHAVLVEIFTQGGAGTLFKRA
ncbi:MAG: acetylglutamate kinase, partial [Alphaproteobacteria bacterium]